MIDGMDAQAKAHLTLSTITIAACLKITLTTGPVYGFTNYNKDLTKDGILYSAMSGQTVSALHTNIGMNVDTIDMETLKTMTGIPIESIRGGLFDNAAFEFFIVNYHDLSQNFGILRRGTLGQITTNRNTYAIELRGMMEAYTKQILDLFSAQCIVDVGSLKCKVRLDPPAWQPSLSYTVRKSGLAEVGSIVKPTTGNRRHFKAIVAGISDASEPTWDTTIGNQTIDGTVTWEAIQALTLEGSVGSVSTANHRIFIDNTLTEPDEFFLGGLLTWTTGQNAGLAFEVKRHATVSGNVEIELILPTFYPIAVADAYTITAGCLKRKDEDCIAKFDNIANFRGFPYIPQNFQVAASQLQPKAVLDLMR
jgi:hypothetical protein